MSLFTAVHSVLPTPNYLRLPSVGVDISDTSLKYIQFWPDYQHEQLTIKTWGDIDMPEGAVARGEVLDIAKLTEALVEVRKKIDTPYVRISLPEERAYLFETQVKRGTAFKEIRGALEFRLEENVPISPRDAFFDYEIIPSEDTRGPLRVSVTAYARETINKYYEAAKAAGLTPLSFEVEASAIARAALPAKERGTHMVIDFGKTRTGVGIVHQGTLMYTSTIDIGGVDLSAALRDTLGDVPEAKLTEIKNTIGLTPSSEYPTVPEVITTEMDAIVSELQLRLQYWNNRVGSMVDSDIRSIILCGGSANLKGLPSYISGALGVEAKRVAVWRNAFSFDEHVPPIDIRHSYGYATAIGLALAGHIAFYD